MQHLISIFGNKGSKLYGLSQDYAYIIKDHGNNVVAMPCPPSMDNGSPVAAFSSVLNIVVIASSNGNVLCCSLFDKTVLWQLKCKPLIRKIIILSASRAVIISGDETVVVSAENGSVINSELSTYHSHISTGEGCLCVKRASAQLYYFDSIWSDGKYVKSKVTRVTDKTATCVTPIVTNSLISWAMQSITCSLSCHLISKHVFEHANWLVCAFFGASGEVIIFNREKGTVVSEIRIPDSSSIDAFGLDIVAEVFLALVRSDSSKRLEIWKVRADGQASLLSQLPEGIGQVGWTFHENSTYLVSRTGRLVEVSTGTLLKSGWVDSCPL